MNSKSVKEGGKHNMYSKSKRFIASFLAVLMAVCMLPADMLGGIATVHAAATLTATFVEDSSAVAATNNVDSGTEVSLAATDTDSEGITHIVWSTSSDLTSMDNDAILAAWSGLSKKEGLASDTIEISGTAGTTVTLTAAAVKYTPAVEADAENNIEAADAAVVKFASGSYAFTINAAKTNLSEAMIELSADTVVTGNDMPTVESVKVTVNGSEQTLSEGTDYEVEYSVDGTPKSAAELKALTVTENTTVTVTVKAKSDSAAYTGNKTATFTITPATTVTVTAPTATPGAGEVTTGTTVALSAGTGADIYYVTKTAAEVGADGFTAPTAAEITGSEDNKYTTAIPVSAAMTIYAVAKVGTDLSSVASYAYTIKAAGNANPFDLVLDFSSSSYEASDNTLPPYDDGYFSFTHDKTKTIQSKTFKVDTNNTYKTAGGSYTYYNVGGNTTGGNVKRAVKFTLSSEAEVIIGGSAGSAASTDTPRRFGLLNDDRTALLSDATQVNCAASNTIYELKLTDLEVGKEYAVGSPDTIYLNYIVVKEKDYQPTKDTIIASEPAGPIQAGTKVTFKAPVGVDIYLAEGETVTTDAANKYNGAEIEITATKKITVVAKAGNAVSAPETYEYTIAQPIAVAPEASVQSGVYTEAQSVTLSSTTADATIYYTTDGKNPVGNANAQATTGAITVDKTQTIKAYAKSDATQASDVVTLTYIIKTAANANKTYTMKPAEEDVKNAPDVDEEGYGDLLTVGTDGYFRLVGIKAKSPVISTIGEVKGTVNGVSNVANYDTTKMTGWPTEAGTLSADSKVLVLTGGQIKKDTNGVVNALRFDASAKAKVTVYYAVKNDTATKIQVYKASKYDDSDLGTAVTVTAPDSTNAAVAKAEFEVAEAGSYYIGFAASGGIIPYMTVEENPGTTNPPADTVAAPTFNPTVAEETTPFEYKFPSTEGKVKIEAEAGATVYYVLSTDTAKYAAFAADTYTTNGTEYTAAMDTAGGITVTDGMAIKAVAVKDGKASTVATSPAYKLGTVAPLAGTVTATQDPTGDIKVGDTVKVTLSYEGSATGVKYLYTVGTDANAAPGFSALPANTVTAGSQSYNAETGIVIPTAAAGTVYVKVLAYTEATTGEGETATTTVTAVASTIVERTYTVLTDTPTAPALVSVTLSGEAKVGKTLTANLTFDPAQTSVPEGVTYQWYRGADAISGATTKSYALTADDEGKTVKVVVTFGETTKEATSDTVAANTSATTGEGLEIEFDDGTTYTYTGAKITPSITVTNNGVELVEGTDYTVKYTNNIKVGKASGTDYDKKAPGVTVTGKGNLSGKTSANFTINARSLKDADAGDVVVVDGSKATIVLLYNGVKLTAKDYEVTEPADFKTKKWAAADAGADKITVKGKGNFSDAEEDAISLDVKVITKEESKNAKISADFADKAAVKALTYTGESQKPAMTVSNKAKATDLVADTDYIVSYPADTTSAGAKKVTILGISEKCTGSVTKSYTIKPAKGGELKVEGVKDSYKFVSTGVTFGDEVTVSYVDTANNIDLDLTEGVDYKITYTNNKKAGTAKYAVTGLGNYKGLKTAKTDFTISGLALSDADTNIKVIAGDKLFTKAGVYKSVPSVIVNGELVKASEYTVSYKVGDDTEWSAKPSKIESIDATVGYVTVKVQIKAKKATGNYGGEVEAGDELEGEYKVVSSDSKKDLAKAKVVFYTKDDAKAAKVGYTGNEVTPYKAVISCKGAEDVTIILDGDDADYATKGFEVTYANNVLKGKATVVIEAKDDNATYAGSKTATFSIVQKNLQKDLGENEGFIKSMSGFFKPFFN